MTLARLVLLLLALSALAAAACDPRGDGPDGVPAEARLVFAEFGASEDRIYVAPAGDLDAREEIARVPHAPGWALTPATEMAGSLAAFVALPPEAEPVRDSPAELWLLDAASGELTRLAGDADLLVAPVFDRAGRYLVYRRSNAAEGTQQLVRVDLATRARRILRELATRFGVFPVAVADDGGVVYAELSNGGTDLYRSDGSGEGGAELLLHASDHIARGWRLSPDGNTLSYLAPRIEAERVVQRLHVTALDGGGEPRIEAGEGFVGDQFSPVWMPTRRRHHLRAGARLRRERSPGHTRPRGRRRAARADRAGAGLRRAARLERRRALPGDAQLRWPRRLRARPRVAGGDHERRRTRDRAGGPRADLHRLAARCLRPRCAGPRAPR